MIKTDVLIIGAGPVGLFTAFQAGMLGMKCCIVDSLEAIGGQCAALYPEKPIYDIPAYKEITGANLVDNLEEQIHRFKPEYHLNQTVTEVRNEAGVFYALTSKGIKIEAKVIVIAAGAGSFVPNRPPLDRIREYEDKSVFYLVKNKAAFAGRKVAIAGGGDSAVDWAIELANIASKVYLIHRRDKFRALSASLDLMRALEKEGKIELVVPYQLKQLEGDNGILKNVIVSDLDDNERNLEADVLLPFFGLATDLGAIKNWGLEFEGYHIKVDQSNSQTNIPGIYAVGDVAHYTGKLKLILVGFSEAALAMHHAYSRVFDGKVLHFEHSTTKGL